MEQVARAVETGALRAGDPLPAVRGLAEELVIHPNAVARAYQALADEGVLTRPDGPGPVLTSGRRMATLSSPGASAVRSAEQAARALLDRELRGAREVQDRLLPQDYPAIDGIDYAGASRPALGVGGDYFDFIRLSERTFGIAVGDVCGKGMPAALLMATLRAALRSQTLGAADSDGSHDTGDLAALIARLN